MQAFGKIKNASRSYDLLVENFLKCTISKPIIGAYDLRFVLICTLFLIF